MKTKVTFLFWLFLLALIQKIDCQSLTLDVPANQSCGKISFIFNTGLSSSLGAGVDYQLFWSFGDGTFDIQTFNSSSIVQVQKQHSYASPIADDTIFVEMTILSYDEVTPPPRYALPKDEIPSNLFNCSSFPEDFEDQQPTDDISLTPVRLLVSNHRITYVIEYNASKVSCLNFSGPGIVKFEYNSDLLSKDDSPTRHFSIDDNQTIALSTNVTEITNGNISTLEWNIEPGEWGRIFIPLKVKPGSLNGSPDARLIYSNIWRCSVEEKIIEREDRVGRSHDPNDIQTPAVYTCNLTPTGTVRYTIRFQNNGDGPATSVQIKNFIPNVYDINSLDIIDPDPDDTNISYSVGPGRQLICNLSSSSLKDGNDLRGTKEIGYEQSFFYEETEDSLVYEVDFNSPVRTFFPCYTIVNRAEIIFDQNDPIFTEPHLLRLGCTLDEEVLNPKCICNESVDFEIAPIQLFSNQVNQLSIDGSILQNFTGNGIKYKWYPDKYLQDDGSSLPADEIYPALVNPDQDIDYYLIVSNTPSCRRKIIKVPVQVTSPPFCSNPFVCYGIPIVLGLAAIIFFTLRRTNG